MDMDAFGILKRNRISVAPYAIVKTKDELLKAAERIRYPNVLKVWDKSIVHKTDVGGVVMDNLSREMMETGFEHLKSKFGDVDILLQKQVKRGIELYIGAKNDPTFGYMVLFGIGGIYVEVFKDVSARICPISESDVNDMINELKAKKIILGFRGKHVNMKELSSLIIKVSRMAEKEKIRELDLNPVKADEEGCYVIDARIVR